MILYDKTKTELGLDFETCKVYSNFYCVCDYCGANFVRSKRSLLAGYKVIRKDSCSKCVVKKREESTFILYGVTNAGATEESLNKIKNTKAKKTKEEIQKIKDKIKQTCIKKYGNTSYLGSKECIEKNKEYFNIDGNKQKSKEKMKKTSLEKYGVDHYAKTDECKEIKKKNCRKKYGVDCTTQLKEVQDKMKSTMISNYGKEHPLQVKEILEKAKNTNFIRHGSHSYPQTEEYKIKSKKTSLERYGCENPQQNSDVREKTDKTCQEKYGAKSFLMTDASKIKTKIWARKNYDVDFYCQTDECKNKSKKTSLEKYGVDSYSKTDEFKNRYKTTCLIKYGVPTTLLSKQFNNFGKTELEIGNWLKYQTGLDFKNDYSVLQNKEIDLFNIKCPLAIEYCGIYWHNELSKSSRGKNYHYDKFKTCLDKNIQLITIFDDEWILRKDQCKSFLKSTLGKFTHRLYARKCKIEVVDKKTGDLFCESYHIQGATNSKIYFGIYHNDDLCGIISLGNHHRLNNSLILKRMCFKTDYQIIGGASKIFSQCIKWAKDNNYKEIITWSDNRWTLGNVYPNLGFSFDGNLPPDYSYVDIKNCKKRLSKQSQKKSNTGCPKDKTEHEWAIEHGLGRIWDCGKIRWKYDRL